MPSEQQTLQADILGIEKAIRLLVGERHAIKSKLRREEAWLKLDENKYHALTTKRHPAVGTGGLIPHGERYPDMSSYQPNVDLRVVRNAGSVKAGVLAFTKITEGTGWVDSHGIERLQQMAALGFPHRGAYHFGHPSESPIEQAVHVMNTLHTGGVHMTENDILCYDCEVTDGESARVVASVAKEFGDVLKKELPCKLWLYGGGPFLQENTVSLDPYDAHWLAAYVGNPFPYMVYGRSRTVSWQYTDGQYGPAPHSCPGIGACDMSIIL